MWSVVTLSPSSASTRAPWMSPTGSRLGGHALEVGRQAHVGRVGIPGEALAGGDRQAVPALVAGEHLAVAAAEHVRAHGLADGLRDLVRGGPDVAEVDVLAVLVLAERVADDVDVHRAGERVGDAQRRRGEVVHLHVRVDAALEVAVARQHRDDREVGVVDGRGDLIGQRAGVADAGRAAVADEVEAERLERLGQPGAVEVLGDDLRAGRERGLDPRLGAQAARERVAGEDAGADHHRRVGGVGAAGDRRDHDVAVVELEALAVERHGRGRAAALERRRGVRGSGSRRCAQRLRVPGRAVGGRVGGRIGLGHRLVLSVGLLAVARDVVLERAPERALARRSARRGPGAAWGRRGSARRWRGRARSCR